MSTTPMPPTTATASSDSAHGTPNTPALSDDTLQGLRGIPRNFARMTTKRMREYTRSHPPKREPSTVLGFLIPNQTLIQFGSWYLRDIVCMDIAALHEAVLVSNGVDMLQVICFYKFPDIVRPIEMMVYVETKYEWGPAVVMADDSREDAMVEPRDDRRVDELRGFLGLEEGVGPYWWPGCTSM